MPKSDEPHGGLLLPSADQRAKAARNSFLEAIAPALRTSNDLSRRLADTAIADTYRVSFRAGVKGALEQLPDGNFMPMIRGSSGRFDAQAVLTRVTPNLPGLAATLAGQAMLVQIENRLAEVNVKLDEAIRKLNAMQKGKIGAALKQLSRLNDLHADQRITTLAIVSNTLETEFESLLTEFTGLSKTVPSPRTSRIGDALRSRDKEIQDALAKLRSSMELILRVLPALIQVTYSRMPPEAAAKVARERLNEVLTLPLDAIIQVGRAIRISPGEPPPEAYWQHIKERIFQLLEVLDRFEGSDAPLVELEFTHDEARHLLDAPDLST